MEGPEHCLGRDRTGGFKRGVALCPGLANHATDMQRKETDGVEAASEGARGGRCPDQGRWQGPEVPGAMGGAGERASALALVTEARPIDDRRVLKQVMACSRSPYLSAFPAVRQFFREAPPVGWEGGSPATRWLVTLCVPLIC